MYIIINYAPVYDYYVHKKVINKRVDRYSVHSS